MFSEFGEVVHHFSHEVHVHHEGGCVTFSQEMIDAEETFFEMFVFGQSHGLGQLAHGIGGFRFVGSCFDGFDEKLQRRFLEDDGGVRSLRLS